jgi:hypothetical protein
MDWSAKNKENEEKMVSKDFDRKDHYELNGIKECD